MWKFFLGLLVVLLHSSIEEDNKAVNKASGCDGIPVELFKTLKDDACHQGVALNMSANLEDPGVATGLEKVNPHPNSQEEEYKRMC